MIWNPETNAFKNFKVRYSYYLFLTKNDKNYAFKLPSTRSDFCFLHSFTFLDRVIFFTKAQTSLQRVLFSQQTRVGTSISMGRKMLLSV